MCARETLKREWISPKENLEFRILLRKRTPWQSPGFGS